MMRLKENNNKAKNRVRLLALVFLTAYLLFIYVKFIFF